MIVVVKENENIDSTLYGMVLEGQEIEVEDAIGLDWIKMGLAYGKDEVHDKGKGYTRTKKKTE